MFYTVYRVTNKISGKFYIGTHKTKNLDDGYYGSGKYLKRAINKHGLDNFEKEILFIFDNPEEMFAKEAEIVNEDFLAEENTYNLRIGGFGGWSHIVIDSDERSRFGKQGAIATNVKRKDPKCREAYKQKIQEFWTTEEREKMSRKCKELYRNGTRVPAFLGKSHTNSTKKKMRERAKDRLKDPTKNGSYGRYWYHDPVTLVKVKCLPEEMPDGFIRGGVPRVETPNTQCSKCGSNTGSTRAKLCSMCRTEKRVRIGKKQATYNGREEELKSLLESGASLSSALRSMGYKFSNTKHGVGRWAVQIRDSIQKT